MEKEAGDSRFEQISGIFSQFSEENKDTLIKVAEDMLKEQEASESEGRCSGEE